IVALALPLYRNLEILKKYMMPLLFGTFFGACIGIISGVYISKWMGFSKDIIYSMLPKSVTTPVAMDISLQISGIPSLSAVFVMFAGIFGAMSAQVLFRTFKITSNIGWGVGIGSASHAIGTARAFENNEEQGSVS